MEEITSIVVSYLSPQQILDLHTSTGISVSTDTLDLRYVDKWGPYLQPYNKKALHTLFVLNLRDLPALAHFNINKLIVDDEAYKIRINFRGLVDYSPLKYLPLTELDALIANPTSADLNFALLEVLKVNGDNLTNAGLSQCISLHTLLLVNFSEPVDLSALPKSLRHLELADLNIVNTAALKNLPLVSFELDDYLDDITVLNGLNLTKLVLRVVPKDILFLTTILSLTSLELLPSRLRDDDIIPLQELRNLTTLHIRMNNLTVNGLQTLTKLPLTSLDFYGNDLNAVRTIYSPTLQYLNIGNCKLHRQFLSHLNMPNLTSLIIDHNPGVYLNGMPSVRVLDARLTSVQDFHLIYGYDITTLKLRRTNLSIYHQWDLLSLKVLTVIDCNLTNISFMRNLSLDKLNISKNKIDDLTPISHMRLQRLVMMQTDISDDQLIHVVEMPLEDLRLSKFTGAGISYITSLPLKVLVFDKTYFDSRYREHLTTLPPYLYEHNFT